MRINRLFVSKYKNVENLNLEFQNKLITLLVGRNGLGKSNLIEILTIIFRQLDLVDTEKELQEWSQSNFQFAVDYLSIDRQISIELLKSPESQDIQLTISTKLEGKETFSPVTFSDFKKNKDIYLPKYIVGYYSGENKRIKEIVSVHEKKSFDALLAQARKPEKDAEPTIRRLFFSENWHSKMILLTLCIYSKTLENPELLKELLEDYLGIEDIATFTVKFNNPSWPYDRIDGINKGLDYLIENLSKEVSNPFWNLPGRVNTLLSDFYNYNFQTHNSEPVMFPNTADDLEDYDKREHVREIIQYADVDVKDLAKIISQSFKTPMAFFDALETTSSLQSLGEISFKIKKKGIETLLDYRDLSEGEQQLMTVIGLVMLFGTDESLFLFDEPDTHLNPLWQRDYVQLLEKFDANNNNSHIFVATHSPLIVQAAEDADIFLYKVTDNKIIVENNPVSIHNWRIDQVLTSEYFNLTSSRPSNLDEYMEFRQKILSKPKLTEEDHQVLRKFENQFGILPTGETIDEIRSLLLIGRIANRIPDKE